MSTQTLGKVSITPKGTYSSSTAYVILDVVTNDGASYLARKASTNVPVTNEEYWLKIAGKGDTGSAAGFGTPTASASALPTGSSPTASVTASGEDTAKIFSFLFGIPAGATGNGIASIAKTSTSGLADTYTVTYTDGTTTTYTVTNGADGDDGTAAGFGTPTASVDANTGTPYVTITASGSDTAKIFDFAFHNLKGATGNGIASIAKTSTSGNVDTYTITMTSGATATFTVTNANIDDTSTAADKTWSASKLNTNFASHSSQIEELAASASERYEGVDLTEKFATEIANYSDEWAWIKARITAHNYSGLRVHDYIPVTCTNGYVLKEEIAGFDTYKGSAATEVPNHIDFISKDCWPDTIQFNLCKYNNGLGCDKFTGDGETATFQLCHRTSNAYPSISKVTVGGTEKMSGTDYTYDSSTGILTFTETPADKTVIKAIWSTLIEMPFLASNAWAYLMSEKCGVPNEEAADPTLTEVDYTNSGVWGRLPEKLKNVIKDKWGYPAVRYTLGSNLSSDKDWKSVNLGKLWLLDEMEVYGCQQYSHSYAVKYGRQYPCFFNGNRKKGSSNGGSRATWWLSAGGASSAAGVCLVYYYGGAASGYASASFRCPVCFRVTA